MCDLFYSFDVVRSSNHSEAFRKAATLFYEHLETTVRRGEASQERAIIDVLSASVGLDLFEHTEYYNNGFRLIADILSSSFSEKGRYRMANAVLLFLGNYFFPNQNEILANLSSLPVKPKWISPLLDFLSLSEKFYATESPPYAGSIALRFISATYVKADRREFDPKANRLRWLFVGSGGFEKTKTAVIPILSSTLLPTHPLQSRSLALNVLHTSLLQLVLSERVAVTAEDFKSLLQALGDPFLFTRDPPLLDWRADPSKPDYEPADTAVLLIELASSELWQNHLDSSNFTTCEEFLSTEEGKRTVVEHMLKSPLPPWLKPLCRATKVAAAIRRLEELQCLNTAEVVIMWAWSVGPFYAEDHNRRLIERMTFSFYQTHGIGRLKALERHITNPSTGVAILGFIQREYREPGLPRKFSVRKLPLPDGASVEEWLRTSQVCQLKRLYHLFGCDPTTGEEMVVDEEIHREMDLLSTLAPISSVDWACDYP